MPKAQKELWQLIVNRLPADTFQDEHLAQLAGYVQHVALPRSWPSNSRSSIPRSLVTVEGRRYFEQLAVALDREHKQVLAFGRALRITISSTYDPITMARKRRAGPHYVRALEGGVVKLEVKACRKLKRELARLDACGADAAGPQCGDGARRGEVCATAGARAHGCLEAQHHGGADGQRRCRTVRRPRSGVGCPDARLAGARAQSSASGNSQRLQGSMVPRPRCFLPTVTRALPTRYVWHY